MDGDPIWTGPDCSLRACPRDYAWVGSVVGANDLHPREECSNKGLCDRRYGLCQCFVGYEGVACQRTSCPNDCHGHGTCLTEKHFAERAKRKYDMAWDAQKHMGCLCDKGYRGYDCRLVECPSGKDPMGGYGNESGRDCSGRGLCDYKNGMCNCFLGMYDYTLVYLQLSYYSPHCMMNTLFCYSSYFIPYKNGMCNCFLGMYDYTLVYLQLSYYSPHCMMNTLFCYSSYFIPYKNGMCNCFLGTYDYTLVYL